MNFKDMLQKEWDNLEYETVEAYDKINEEIEKYVQCRINSLDRYYELQARNIDAKEILDDEELNDDWCIEDEQLDFLWSCLYHYIDLEKQMAEIEADMKRIGARVEQDDVYTGHEGCGA